MQRLPGWMHARLSCATYWLRLLVIYLCRKVKRSIVSWPSGLSDDMCALAKGKFRRRRNVARRGKVEMLVGYPCGVRDRASVEYLTTTDHAACVFARCRVLNANPESDLHGTARPASWWSSNPSMARRVRSPSPSHDDVDVPYVPAAVGARRGGRRHH